jgi:ribosomal protein S18 acetylase RimI-like enzyme
MNWLIRAAVQADHAALKALYKHVAAQPGGLARRPDDVTDNFIASLLGLAFPSGLTLVMEHAGELIGAIHASCPDATYKRHVMNHLTVLVHPGHQGLGLGAKIFSAFLEEIRSNFTSVLRVELAARASNEGALHLYRRLGFQPEARFEKAIEAPGGEFEAGIHMVWFNPGFVATQRRPEVSRSPVSPA